MHMVICLDVYGLFCLLECKLMEAGALLAVFTSVSAGPRTVPGIQGHSINISRMSE